MLDIHASTLGDDSHVQQKVRLPRNVQTMSLGFSRICPEGYAWPRKLMADAFSIGQFHTYFILQFLLSFHSNGFKTTLLDYP